MAVSKYFTGFIVVLAYACCSLSGCEQKLSRVHDHPGYLDHIFTGDALSPADEPAHFVHKIDSVYGALQTPGAGDAWEKHFTKFTIYYFNQVDYPRARLYVDSMLADLGENTTDSAYVSKHARSLFYKGDTYLAEKNYAEAFNWYYQARLVITESADVCAFSQYSSRLGSACYRQGKYSEAASYFKDALREEISCGDHSFQLFADVQGGFDNIGIAYSKIGMKDSAAVYFQKALDYIAENEKRFPDRADFMSMARAVIYGNQANVLIADKKFAKAEMLLQNSISINATRDHAPEDAAYSRIKLARIYLEQQRAGEVKQMLPQLDSAKHVYRNPELAEGYYQVRSRLAEMDGDHKTAYEYLALYDALRDSVTAANAPIASLDVQQSLNNISKQYQLSFLQKQNKLKSDYLWLFVVIAFLGIVIFILLLINYRRSHKTVRELTALHDTVTNRNNALQQTLTALEHSHQNNSRFMKIVAHDLRGPVGSITSLARMAQKGTIAPERYTEMLDAIYESGTKSMSLINGLLSDMEASGQLTHIEPLNVEDTIKYCVELYTYQVQQKNLTVSLQTIPAFINGDQEKLWRVFSNLINNAVKFSANGGMIIITMHLHEGNVVIAIHDHGIGIPEDFKNKIFAAEAVSRQGTSGEASFGLGLSISKQIITLHNGRIWFESVPGQGASFYVSLPVVSAG